MATKVNYLVEESIQEFLNPVNADNPSGVNLYYDAVYDQIKEARREDDPTLSQGIWETDLQKADWPLVEELVSRALMTQTKDLQLVGWLIEAWTARDHLQGFIKGITLMQKLIEAYWDTVYPQGEGNDYERRMHVFEWLDTTLSRRLVMLSFFTDPFNNTSVSLADWIQANRLESTAKRSANPQKILQKAEQQQEKTIEKIHHILKAQSQIFLEDLLVTLQQALQKYEDFKMYLDSLCKEESRPAMNQVSEMLREGERFIKGGMVNLQGEKKEQPEMFSSKAEADKEISPLQPVIPETILNSRSQAYQLIDKISVFLQTVEPHSPTPVLLKRIATWENKSILEIFKEFGTTPDEWAMLTKFIEKDPSS